MCLRSLETVSSHLFGLLLNILWFSYVFEVITFCVYSR